ncbi:MAG: DEAD/DEAH box helicase [Planctomycetes bacterium]|nr:DEAD/DEAH box helicase [Planctomycetota bacterium]
MDAAGFIDRIRSARDYRGELAHVVSLPERPARHADPEGGIAEPVRKALAARGIERLYIHQAAAIDAIRKGRPVAIVTGTASGKSLAYQIPILEAALADRRATALALYPTKALAQDQLRGFEALRAASGADLVAGTYDGDTPQDLRRKLRARANLVLTNPDMLHQGILPHHARWGRFFAKLRLVILDEVHTYRGVFGANVSNVIRRLRRIAAHHGGHPVFVLCSATIANPSELASRILNEPADVIDDDGSPRGPKTFAFWNPPLREHGGTDRESSLGAAARILTQLVLEEVQTIAFTRTRLGAELLLKFARERLARHGARWAEAISAYRGGYLPEERREIERRLAEGSLLGVASTNALELGIDIGSLDAALVVGYPGTIASTWQQAGRAGRGREPSLAIFIAENSPIDQHLVAFPGFVLGRSPENAVLDPDNAFVVLGHLQCAMHEIPARAGELAGFGPYAANLAEILSDEGRIRERSGIFYYIDPAYPAAGVSLRNATPIIYTIMDTAGGERVIGTMDETSAFTMLHKGAIYIHGAETFYVRDLDVQKKIAWVEARAVDYFTQAVTDSKLIVQRADDPAPPAWRGARVGHGDVAVTTAVPMFKKVRFWTRESIGFEKLELPPQKVETTSLWIAPPPAVRDRLLEHGRVPGEALVGIANLVVEVAPIFILCDPSDIGAVTDATNLGEEAIFIYDRHPGGMGFSQRALDLIEPLFAAARERAASCPCKTGCPSCVGAAVPRFAQTDIDSGTRGRIPDKEAALIALHGLLGLEPYIPKYPPPAEVAPPEGLPPKEPRERAETIRARIRDKLRGKVEGERA